MNNEDYVKSIAETALRTFNGHIYNCPCCGNSYDDANLSGHETEDGYTCPNCTDSILEVSDLWDYVTSDIYNIEYRVNGKESDEINSVRLCVAFGGPNIYIDTGDQKVKLYWWGEYAECRIDSDVCDEIDSIYSEIWNMAYYRRR